MIVIELPLAAKKGGESPSGFDRFFLHEKMTAVEPNASRPRRERSPPGSERGLGKPSEDLASPEYECRARNCFPGRDIDSVGGQIRSGRGAIVFAISVDSGWIGPVLAILCNDAWIKNGNRLGTRSAPNHFLNVSSRQNVLRSGRRS